VTGGERGRDLLVAGAFLAVIGALVVVGWLNRERVALPAEGPAPSLELPLLEGGTASLDSLRGRVVMVNIWATWCAPCRREMPSMQRVYERFAGDGFAILAVAVDDDPGDRGEDGRIDGKVSAFVEEYGLTFPVAVDPTGGTERLFGTQYLPTTLLIDRSGTIRVREIGGRYWDREPYIDMIETLLEEE
jgi:cytochrome c biogenesis protein CcmG/thiol:disulfide interchange protein DsbE